MRAELPAGLVGKTWQAKIPPKPGGPGAQGPAGLGSASSFGYPFGLPIFLARGSPGPSAGQSANLTEFSVEASEQML